MAVSGKSRLNTLCFIHGWGFDSRVLSGLAAEFSEDWNTQLLDMPGYGENQTARLPADINTAADVLIAEIPVGSILLGWSLGGMLAIKVAHKLRDRVRAIVLLASTPCFVNKEDWPYGIESSFIQNMTERITVNAAEVLQEFAGLIAQGDVSPRQTLRKLKLLLKSSCANSGALLSGLNILMNADLRKELSELECEMMMISGKEDRLIAAGTGTASRKIQPALQLNDIQETGHAPFISRRNEVVDVIGKYLHGLEK